MTTILQNKDLLMRVATVAADAVVARLHPQLDELSKRQADELHGRRWLDYQIAAGNIAPVKKGPAKNSKKVYSRTEINALWQAEVLNNSNILIK
jgi:hypothetical protein